MGELDLNELERLAKAATPGPWEWWTSNSFLRLSGPDGRDGGVLYACNIRNEYATVVVSEADRRFIAEARTALPALIARIRDLEDFVKYQEVIIAKAAEKIPKLEQDAARLDWLAHHGASLRKDPDGAQLWYLVVPYHTGTPVDDYPRHPTPRAAIEAARKEKGHG